MFARILEFVQRALSACLVPFQWAQAYIAKQVNISPAFRYLLEAVLILVVVIAMLVVNRVSDVEGLVNPPPRYFWIRKVFLGLVVFLTYLAIRIFIYILNQLPRSIEEFPDIDRALAEGLAALGQARIDLNETPLFLIVGMTPRAEESFAQSSLIGKEIKVTGRDLPLHWFGNEKGIWINLAGVSALSQQAILSASGAGGAAAGSGPATGGIDPGATLAGDAERYASIPAGARGSGGAEPEAGGAGAASAAMYQTLGPGGAAAYATLGAAELATVAKPEGGYKSPVRRLSQDEKDLATRRIHYFVRRLREARYPVCSINGVLVVIPYLWTTSPGMAQSADSAQVDMAALQNTLGVKALSMTVFDGIGEAPEFAEYIQRQDRQQVERRCGCGFPPLVALEMGDMERMHQWLLGYFERQIFELCQKKLGDPGNAKLVRLLDSLRKSKQNLVRVLRHAFPEEVTEPFYFGGIYFASLTPVGASARPFMDGVIAKLLKEHDEVIGWNDQALAEDLRQGRMAQTVMFFAVALTALSALLVAWIVFFKK